MHADRSDSPIPTTSPRAPERDPRSDGAQAAILSLLLGEDHHGLWSREELERTLSADPLSVKDAIAELLAAGLVYQLDQFLLASQAARSFDRLDL
ncbi:MAG: hypothetical protein WBV85_01425 [Solirubrobacteraceae bacterium]